MEYNTQAYELIRPYITNTPVVVNEETNRELGAECFFKCENLQKTGSFKYRGATHALLKLDESSRSKGVVTVSSGNHGAAMAKAGKVLNIKVHVIVPKNITSAKLENIRQYSPEIIYSEPGMTGREAALEEFRANHESLFISPYDHRDIILGQASSAYELIQEIRGLDYIVFPVGGGGLASGSILASRAFSPDTKLIGAEPANADDAYQSLLEGKLVPQSNPDTICDGLKSSLGRLTFPIIVDGLEQVILASEGEIVSAMKLLHERLEMVIEPSSATAYAAVSKSVELFRGKKVGIILTGGNVDREIYDGNN